MAVRAQFCGTISQYQVIRLSSECVCESLCVYKDIYLFIDICPTTPTLDSVIFQHAVVLCSLRVCGMSVGEFIVNGARRERI